MKHYKLLILGGGTGGISLGARMVKHLGQGKVGLIEPAQYHYYQPFWTLIGAGVGKKEWTQKTNEFSYARRRRLVTTKS